MALYVGGEKFERDPLKEQVEELLNGVCVCCGINPKTEGSPINGFAAFTREYIAKCLKAFNGKVDDGKRLHLSCLCDSTMVFLKEMVEVLKLLGCTEIETGSRIAGEEETMPGRPWCNCLFEASGVLPKDLVVKVGLDEED